MASKAQGRETRERLLRAATESFVENGFGATSLNAIAQAAGVTRQALLHYFPSKPDLLAAVLDEAEQERRKAGESEAVELGWTAGLVAIMERNLEEPGLSALVIAAATESGPPGSPLHEFLRGRAERVQRDMTVAVEAEQTAGRLTRDLDADALAVGLIGLYQGLLVARIVRPELDVTAPFAAILRKLTP